MIWPVDSPVRCVRFKVRCSSASVSESRHRLLALSVFLGLVQEKSHIGRLNLLELAALRSPLFHRLHMSPLHLASTSFRLPFWKFPPISREKGHIPLNESISPPPPLHMHIHILPTIPTSHNTPPLVLLLLLHKKTNSQLCRSSPSGCEEVFVCRCCSDSVFLQF